jgi:phosphoenolpyruvate phosphomutase
MKKEGYLSNNKNRPIAFVPMCLDPIHYGHINIIKEAKKYGNVVIGLMTDEAMLSYKRKPRIKFKERLIVCEELKPVSYILPLDGIDYSTVAEKYKFEYFLHGDDWKSNIQSDSRKKLIEVMKNWGGVVIDVPYTKGISSSSIIPNFKS